MKRALELLRLEKVMLVDQIGGDVHPQKFHSAEKCCLGMGAFTFAQTSWGLWSAPVHGGPIKSKNLIY